MRTTADRKEKRLMFSLGVSPQRGALGGAVIVALLLLPPAAVKPQPGKVLRIGASGSLGDGKSKKEKVAVEALQKFIAEETGLANEITHEKDWRELAEKMAKGQMPLGMFQGYEFSWAQEKYPTLHPLAVAVNVHVYQSAYVLVRKDSKAKDIAALQGQNLALPITDQGFIRLFLNKETKTVNGKKPEEFFAKISTPATTEEAIDDVVDAVVQATVIDRAALESYKRRKPGRFNQLKEMTQSQPFPPGVVAYYDAVLDKKTLHRFRDGLINASRKEKGETLLTLFKLSGFQAVPADFERVLAETRKTYRPDDGSK
jgi:ABC-type phosphate/phosphonate transport system substrate-binding protein